MPRLASSGLEADVLASVSSVRPQAWDALVGEDNFYHSHGWLRALEYAHGPSQVLAVRQAGALVAAVPTWSASRDPSGLFDLDAIFQRMRRAWTENPLWLGARRAVYQEIRPAGGTTVLRGLLDAARKLARRRGHPLVAAPYLAATDAARLAASHPAAQAMLLTADATVDIPPDGFAGLHAGGNRQDRARHRTERRRYQRSGATTVCTALTAEVANVAADLIAQTRTKYGSPDGPDYVRRAFQAQLRAGVLDRAVAFLAMRGGNAVAAIVCYRYGRRLYARSFGANYAHTERAGEYFILTYHEPIDYAARHGLRSYHVAISNSDVKVRHGAVLSPLAAVVLPADGDRPLLDADTVARHNNSTAAQWLERYAHRPQALGPGWRTWLTNPVEGTPTCFT